MPKPLVVFISSTSEDLKEYRRAAAEVVQAAGWLAVVMDNWPPDPDSITVLCERKVSESDLLILLQARRRGGVPAQEWGGDGVASYTAHEFWAAEKLRKDVLVFLADNLWPGILFEDDAAAQAWVKNFVGNVINRHAAFFRHEQGELPEFKLKVREALVTHKERLLAREEARLQQAPPPAASPAAVAPEPTGPAPVALLPVSARDFPPEPYPLLTHYKHPDTFAGRDAELKHLDILLRRPPLVLCLHAPSGAGKSSLLDAGLVPRLRAAGYPVSLNRYPGEPRLAHRLVADLLALPSSVTLDDDQPDIADAFARWIEHAGALAGKPPVLILDQVDDVLRQPEAREAVLARLGPLMARTAQGLPGGQGFACRWVLCYRHEFHGEVAVWLRDVLNQARRAGRPGLDLLPHDLSDNHRLDSWPLPLLGAPHPGEPPEDVAARVFLAAIERPLGLRLDDGSLRYHERFAATGAVRLASAFAAARTRQPDAPLAPELQVVLSHLLESATSGPDGERLVHVPEDPAQLGTLVDDALARHLRQALERAFPPGGDPEMMRTGRARALLALRALVDDSGRRGEWLPRDEVVRILGAGGETVLRELVSPRTRVVVEERRGERYFCALAHDRMAEVILRFMKGQIGALEIDRPVVEMKRSVNLRSALFEGHDDTALNVTPEQHALIAANAPALVRSAEERQWWEQADAWFRVVERLRSDSPTAFTALTELARDEHADWPRVLGRLRRVAISARVFWQGPWDGDAARSGEDILRVVERAHSAFLSPDEMFRAVSYAVEEVTRRHPALAGQAHELRVRLREAYVQERGTATLPPLFRSDYAYLPDEPSLGFIETPGGPFRMGSDKAKDPQAFDDEIPPVKRGWFSQGAGSIQGTVDVPAFFIARYPVTVAQFTAFVKAESFRVGYPDALKEEPERPIVTVSWAEARQYCQWLERTVRGWPEAPEPLRRALASGWHVGLPSEAEWEKAARGTDGRIYPWGNEPADPSGANYLDTKLGRTSVVGAFPLGASPYGVLDMSGNVLEWTRSLMKPYPYEPGDGRESMTAKGNRVVRGGAFNSGDRDVSCRQPQRPRSRLSQPLRRVSCRGLPFGHLTL
jgi:formylglycine-generating enzyme required for sulfatase activity